MVAFIGNWKCSNEGMDMMYNFKDKVELVITTFMGEMTTKYELLPAENKHERMDISFPISSPDPTSTQPQMMTLHCYYKYDKDQDVLTLWCPKQSENMSEQKPIEECDELVCHRHVHKLPPEVEKMTEDERLLKAVEEIRNFVVKRIAAVAVLHPGSEEEVMNYAMGDVKVVQEMTAIPGKYGLHYQKMEQMKSEGSAEIKKAFEEMDDKIQQAARDVASGKEVVIPGETKDKKKKKNKKKKKKKTKSAEASDASKDGDDSDKSSTWLVAGGVAVAVAAVVATAFYFKSKKVESK